MYTKRRRNYFIEFIITLGLLIIALGVLIEVAVQKRTDEEELTIVRFVETATPEPTEAHEDTIHYISSQEIDNTDTASSDNPDVEEEIKDFEPYTESDVELLARIMTAESGPYWPDWAMMTVGEVVLNRVASPEFPDSIYDVLYQSNPIQYSPVFNGAWDSISVSDHAMELARMLLEGERPVGDPSMVFQALFSQGSQTLVTFYDTYLGSTTYFCTSYNRELYES